MKRLRSPKACAALVMIAWLASLISLWGMSAAGARAVGADASCSPGDLENVGIRLEMASRPEQVPAILGAGPSGPDRAGCVRKGAAALVRADALFLVCYSLLALALFLFVRVLRASSARPALLAILPALGLLLALTMASGDFVENRHLTEVIRLAGEAGPPLDRIEEQLSGLKRAAYVKMGALALSSLLLGALWPSRSRWVWVPRLLGFAAAALFIAAMIQDSRHDILKVLAGPLRGRQIHDWEVAGLAMAVFALFAFSALIHAIAVAVDRAPHAVPQPVPTQGGSKP